eukprot:scaffold38857_cov63-Phaeocystis_antarctica.AAC.5
MATQFFVCAAPRSRLHNPLLSSALLLVEPAVHIPAVLYFTRDGHTLNGNADRKNKTRTTAHALRTQQASHVLYYLCLPYSDCRNICATLVSGSARAPSVVSATSSATGASGARMS